MILLGPYDFDLSSCPHYIATEPGQELQEGGRQLGVVKHLAHVVKNVSFLEYEPLYLMSLLPQDVREDPKDVEDYLLVLKLLSQTPAQKGKKIEFRG